MERLLVLPGIASPSQPTYPPIYEAISAEAENRGLEHFQMSYPGQSGPESGRLDFSNALSAAKRCSEVFRPDRVIGLSFGCLVALGLFADRQSWAPHSGVVLWGPPTRAAVERLIPDRIAETHEIQRYAEELDTWLTQDFFETLPRLEDLSLNIGRRVRLARGSEDKYNTLTELLALASRSVPSNIEVVEVEGLGHGVKTDCLNERQLHDYFSALFE